MRYRVVRNIRADLRWGLGWTLSITALCFVPAFLVLITSGASTIVRDGATFVELFGAYMAFGGAAGLIIGLCRPVLTTKLGAASVGAALGAAGFVALIFGSQVMKGSFNTDEAVFAAVLGAITGGFSGLWFRWRAKVWQRFTDRIRSGRGLRE